MVAATVSFDGSLSRHLVLLLVCVFALSCRPLLFSFVLSSSSSSSSCVVAVLGLLRHIHTNSNSDLARILHFVFCVVDMPYTLPGCLYYIFRVSLVASFSVAPEPVTLADYFAMDNTVLPTLLIMVGLYVSC